MKKVILLFAMFAFIGAGYATPDANFSDATGIYCGNCKGGHKCGDDCKKDCKKAKKCKKSGKKCCAKKSASAGSKSCSGATAVKKTSCSHKSAAKTGTDDKEKSEKDQK